VIYRNSHAKLEAQRMQETGLLHDFGTKGNIWCIPNYMLTTKAQQRSEIMLLEANQGDRNAPTAASSFSNPLASAAATSGKPGTGTLVRDHKFFNVTEPARHTNRGLGFELANSG
jgi:hypothetical protein